MPIYDYKCEECEIVEELLQSMNDTNIPKCPKCNKPMERVFSRGTSFRLAGGGWARDSYTTKKGKVPDEKT